MNLNLYYQDEGITKEFSGLDSVQIQTKCRNLKFGYQFLEYNGNSFIAITTSDSVSIFIADENNKYIPLEITIDEVKK